MSLVLTEDIGSAMGGIMSTLLLFPVERTIFIREHAMGSYSTLVYYMARLLAETPFLTIFPVVFCCISYWMVHVMPSLTMITC